MSGLLRLGFNWMGIGPASGRATATLNTLVFSTSSFATGTPASGIIIGTTPGSTLAATGLPTGLTINSAARTLAWDGSGAPANGLFTLTETLGAESHNSTIAYAIAPNSGAAATGQLDFSHAANSGLLLLLEDI